MTFLNEQRQSIGEQLRRRIVRGKGKEEEKREEASDGGKSLARRGGHLCAIRWKARSHQSLSSLVRNRRQVFTFPRDGVQANRSKYTGRPTFYPIIPHRVEFLSWSFDQCSTDWEPAEGGWGGGPESSNGACVLLNRNPSYPFRVGE